MIQLLAQVTSDPSPQLLKDWLGVVLYIVGIATAILGVLVLIKQLREKPAETPQPLVVQGHVGFTPLSDHEDLEERLERHETKTDERFLDMAQASSASREKIYNLVRAEAASTRGEFNGKIDGLTKSINDTLVALGRAEGELRANRAKQSSG